MGTAGASHIAVPSPVPTGGAGATPPDVVTVYNCSRLGRTANPPRQSFIAWLRFGRRR